MNTKVPNAVTIGFFIVLVVLFGLLFVSQKNMVTLPLIEKPVPTQIPSREDQPITIRGVIDCLPHKETSGGQTMECAFGLQGEDGKYYGLKDLSEERLISGDINAGKKVMIVGTTEPVKTTSYAIEKTISVQQLTVLPDQGEKEQPKPTSPSNTTDSGAGMYVK